MIRKLLIPLLVALQYAVFPSEMLATGNNEASSVAATVYHEAAMKDWAGFCMVTFTNDYVHKASLGGGKWDLSIRKGDQFLISRFPERELSPTFLDRILHLFLGALWKLPNRTAAQVGYSLYRLTPEGPKDFYVPKTHSKHYSVNCEQDLSEIYLAVLANLVVYSDVDTTKPVCQLTKGSAKPFTAWNGKPIRSTYQILPDKSWVSKQSLEPFCSSPTGDYFLKPMKESGLRKSNPFLFWIFKAK